MSVRDAPVRDMNGTRMDEGREPAWDSKRDPNRLVGGASCGRRGER